MKLLKVLNKDLKSPYQNFQFEIGKKYHCEDFDKANKAVQGGFMRPILTDYLTHTTSIERYLNVRWVVNQKSLMFTRDGMRILN